MIINNIWAWNSVGYHIIQPISELKTYYTTFLLVIYIIKYDLTYLNYSSVEIVFVNCS